MAVCGMMIAACAPPDPPRVPSSAGAVATASVDSTPPASAEYIAPAAPEARPRLSRTITLGQGADSAYSAPSQAPAPGTAGGTPVVVNNTVVVQNGGYVGYPSYGYGYGYGGYGAGGYRLGSGGRTDGRGASRAGGPSTWSTTGWEGARRTAAPGQTPVIGGNWSPPPSYGPAQMK